MMQCEEASEHEGVKEGDQEGDKEGVKEGEKREENVNSVHEDIDVLNRHMTWWRNAWWIRVDNGPHMRSARGRRRTWRAARKTAEQVRDGNWVGQTRERDGRRERDRTGKKGGERRPSLQQQQQPSSNSSRRSTTTAQNTTIKECIWFDRDANEIVFQPLHPATGALLRNERATAVREEPAPRPELYY